MMGSQTPLTDTKKPARRLASIYAQGMEAVWPRLQARFTTARPEGRAAHGEPIESQ